ncbi:hypothetical protein ASPVEDRAFT_663820 [Aspergillus versicolor CBS 583.65]|uniref:Neutral protease 2 n=1 Tax=Aspergillus versicolor CBS 583.65 TaxID=1036611 RepID=A0A1L9PLC2_ASPVE|nr:uncharacterized protein ASPVEDRAFT_663820 [Aspergillus versicolor CBS 583.65]OJJ02235.1 hypothetical protein ASPVEDRAFT_663820 [Aspergillus versicolor CBS 583.65]
MALFLFFYLLAVLTLASGKPILIPRQAGEATQDVAQPSFDVAIETLGNTTVRAEITNLGSEGVRLSQRGGILDHVPTKKVIVQGGDSDPTFIGAHVEYILAHLTADGFVEVAPNKTVASTFDIADIYDLTPGQEYTAVAKGALEYTTLDNKSKFRTAKYTSNNISFTAPADLTRRMEQRSVLECSDENKAAVQEAILRAAKMATAAAKDARTGSSLFEKFFKTTSQSDIEKVAGRFEAIAKEATTTGQLTYYCEPTADDYCSSNVAAMTYPSLNKVVNCPAYYTSTRESNYCGYLDQAAITLHEYSHASALYSPGTEDVGYGWDSVLSLNTEDSMNNADNFAYYASAVYLQCAADDSVTIGKALDVDLGINIGGSGDSGDSTETTTTVEPTNTPEPTPTGTTGTGSDTGGDTGGNDGGNDGGDTGAGTGTGTETGTGTGDWGTWGWGWGSGSGSWSGSGSDSTNNVAPSSTPTTAPVTTTTGEGLWNLQDLIDWLWNQYGSGGGQTQGQGNAQVQGQTQTQDQGGISVSNSDQETAANVETATTTQVAETEEDCDEEEQEPTQTQGQGGNPKSNSNQETVVVVETATVTQVV